MFDDEELERARMHELRHGYPERIYLVGGPYCGFYLMPHHEIISNVWTELTGQGLNPQFTPKNFHPLDEQNIVFVGALGAARYRLDDHLRWSFVELIELEPV